MSYTALIFERQVLKRVIVFASNLPSELIMLSSFLMFIFAFNSVFSHLNVNSNDGTYS